MVVVTVSNPSWSPAPGSTTPLRIESSSLSSPVTEGQTLDLNCVIASPAQATVTWYRRGGTLPAKHQVGNMERGYHQAGRMGMTYSSGQDQVVHTSPGDPMQILMIPYKVGWSWAGSGGPMTTEA